MLDWTGYLFTLLPLAVIGLGGWLLSLRLNDVSIVDSLWSLMFLLTGVTYLFAGGVQGPRALLVLLLVAAWSIRLSVHITLRNRGEGEDHRYQAIRANNQPGFRYKSLYIVFGLQALLAWLIGMPLAAAMETSSPLGWLDATAVLLWSAGMYFEVVGDMQLTRFKADLANRGKVLDHGLWALTRHPNYFGECLIWWAYFLLAVAAGGWWTIGSPALMTLLLLRVSGVALLEKDIADRRPAYVDYKKRTSAFIPWPGKVNP